MQVLPVNTFQNNYRPVNFKSNFRDIAGNMKCQSFTMIFRGDFDWHVFSYFLQNKYKNVDRVNLIIHACSSGEEAFSVVSKLIEDIGLKGASKFLPILAKDIDEENIISAKSGKIYLAPGENYAIQMNVGDYNDYFEYSRVYGLGTISAKSILMNNIKFERGDIFEDISKFPDKNTVLFCRNLWLWLEPEKQIELVDKIASKFKDNSSLVLIGNADRENTDIVSLLENRGFKETHLFNAFSR